MLTKEETEKRMKTALDYLDNELKNIRTGRANPAMVENVKVEVYGTQMRLMDIATISSPEPMQILIAPFDVQNTAAIGKGIEKANIGFNSIVEGNVVRINIPPMDGQMREKMKKLVHELCEQTKIKVRQARKEANDAIKANKDFSEDERKSQEKVIQELTDKYCDIADKHAEKKEGEISNI